MEQYAIVVNCTCTHFVSKALLMVIMIIAPIITSTLRELSAIRALTL